MYAREQYFVAAAPPPPPALQYADEQQYDAVAAAPPPSYGGDAPAPVRFRLPRIHLLAHVKAGNAMAVLNNVLAAAILVLGVFILLRLPHGAGSASVGAGAADASAPPPGWLDAAAFSSGRYTGVAVSGSGEAVGEYAAATMAAAYACMRARPPAVGALSDSTVWVLLGDETAAGAGASPWVSQLMSRAGVSATATLYNMAGAGFDGVANVTLQVAALQRDRSFTAALASGADVAVVVSAGRAAASAAGVEAMLASLWTAPSSDFAPLVTPATRARIHVVLVVPADPAWGGASAVCGDAGDKATRRTIRSIYYAVALRNGVAAVVDLDAAFGRFSLAMAPLASAFYTACDVPLYNAQGQTAMAELLWRCLATDAGTYDIPARISEP